MNNRMLRADSEIKRVLSEIINNRINDPRITSEIITVTKVKTSADFMHCKVSISILSDDKNKRKNLLELLKKSSGFIKKNVANDLNIKNVPDFVFVLDDGELYSKEISDILETLDIPPIEEDCGEKE